MSRWSRSMSCLFQSQAEDWAALVYRTNAVPVLSELVNVRFNQDLGTSVAAARLSPIRSLDLSSVHWGYLGEALKRHTVIHLACHHVVYHQAVERSGLVGYHPHGVAWRGAMGEAGEPLDPWEAIDDPHLAGVLSTSRICTLDSTPHSNAQLLRLG